MAADAADAADAAADAAGESLCEKKFFDERAEVAALLLRLVGAPESEGEGESAVDAAFLQSHAAVTQIVRLLRL